VGFVLATVVQGLSFRALRALPAAVRPIDDQFYRLSLAAFLLSKLARSAFRHHFQRLQGLLQEGQQVRHPVVDARLAQLKPLAQQRLQGIGLLIDQKKEQFLLRRPQLPFAPSSDCTLTYGASLRSVRPGLFVKFGEHRQQHAKLFGGQARQGQQLPPILLQPLVFKHPPIVAYFG
jgi:hypothetical protein